MKTHHESNLQKAWAIRTVGETGTAVQNHSQLKFKVNLLRNQPVPVNQNRELSFQAITKFAFSDSPRANSAIVVRMNDLRPAVLLQVWRLP